MKIMENGEEFEAWVEANRPGPQMSYGKGWWDYIETLSMVRRKFGFAPLAVLSSYVLETPAPQEQLRMPIVELRGRGCRFVLRYEFGIWPPEIWTLSVERESLYEGETYGLFRPSEDLRGRARAGMEPGWMYGPLSVNRRRFSCEVADEWDLVCCLRLFTAQNSAVSARSCLRPRRVHGEAKVYSGR